MDIAGWSSSVARRAHNPKVVGSNPAPATKNPEGCAFGIFLWKSRLFLMSNFCSPFKSPPVIPKERTAVSACSSLAISKYPMTAFNGVRISWFMHDIKSPLA